MQNTPQNEVEILREKLSDLEVIINHLHAQLDIKTGELETKAIELEIKNIELETKNIELETVTARFGKKEAEYIQLIQKHIEAQRHRFGQKSERFVSEENPQMPLFPVEFDSSEPPAPPEDIETVTYTRKRGGQRRELDMSGLPQREEIIPVNEKDRVCSCCGKDKKPAGYQSSSRLHVIPAQFEVVTEKREKLACPNGCEGEFVTAQLPLRVLPKSVASESLIAHIVISKVLDRQPLYHLEKTMETRYGWKIGRNMMARWMIMVADRLQPLINLMKDQIEGYDIASIDATSFHVLKELGRKSQTKSFAYCLRGGPPDKKVILYEYNAYSQKNYVEETLEYFKGVLQCDASPVFNKIREKEAVRLSYCHVHARRKFEQIEKASKKGKARLATEAMHFYRQLYEIERDATKHKFCPDKREQQRQEKSRPLLDDFYRWLTINRDATLPQSPIGKAITYCITHWDGLLTYLEDGRIEIDNNSTERDIKPFVMARKNFLFACTQAGADSLGVHFSLILTARLHGLNPMEYYTEILKRIPYCNTVEDFEALLPWNFKTLVPDT
jgi:transposase